MRRNRLCANPEELTKYRTVHCVRVRSHIRYVARVVIVAIVAIARIRCTLLSAVKTVVVTLPAQHSVAYV